MKLIKFIENIILERDRIGKLIVQASNTKPIADAIKNRRKISFYYSGPRKPKKNSVQAGKRILVEPVAMGLNFKGKLIIRAWVEPPSISKKGFSKSNWRTFILARARDIEITDEIFDQKRPGYKEGDDGSMSVTYVTSNWTKTPSLKKYKEPLKPRIKKEPVSTEPEKPEEPSIKEPQVQPQQKVEPKKEILPQPKPEKKPELPKEKPNQEVPATDLPQPKPENKPEENPEDNPDDEENTTLSEEIKRIKSLMIW